MLTQQLTLNLLQRKAPPRQLPAIDRLRAVLTRQGFDWQYRASRGSVLIRPLFGPHFGYQPMCGRYCCGDLVFERLGYREHQPVKSRADREEHLAYLESRRQDIYELWGKPC